MSLLTSANSCQFIQFNTGIIRAPVPKEKNQIIITTNAHYVTHYKWIHSKCVDLEGVMCPNWILIPNQLQNQRSIHLFDAVGLSTSQTTHVGTSSSLHPWMMNAYSQSAFNHTWWWWFETYQDPYYELGRWIWQPLAHIVLCHPWSMWPQ